MNFLLEQVRRPILSVCLLKKLEMTINQRNRLWKCYQMMIFHNILKELVDFGISRYERDYRNSYAKTDLVLYQKYTYEDVCRLLNWAQNEVPLNIGGYKFDKKTKTFPVFINYDKEENISDTTKYEDHLFLDFEIV